MVCNIFAPYGFLADTRAFSGVRNIARLVVCTRVNLVNSFKFGVFNMICVKSTQRANQFFRRVRDWIGVWFKARVRFSRVKISIRVKLRVNSNRDDLLGNLFRRLQPIDLNLDLLSINHLDHA